MATFDDLELHNLKSPLAFPLDEDLLGKPPKPISPPSRPGLVESLLRPLFKLLGFVRSATLLFAAVASGLLASTGLVVVTALLFTRWASHDRVHYSQPVFFDYSEPKVTAMAWFLGNGAAGGIDPAYSAPDSVAPARFVQPGQVMGVWLELELPQDHQPPAFIFQVVCELQSADGRVAARVSRPFRFSHPQGRARSLLGRMLGRIWGVFWPWRRAAPLPRVVSVPLFDQYEEKVGVPFQVARVAMVGRAGTGPVPEVLESSVHVQLQLGLLGRLLYKLRPGLLSLAVLLPLALGAGAGGAVLAAVFALLWLYTLRPSRQPLGGGGGGGAVGESSEYATLPGSLSSSGQEEEEEGGGHYMAFGGGGRFGLGGGGGGPSAQGIGASAAAGGRGAVGGGGITPTGPPSSGDSELTLEGDEDDDDDDISLLSDEEEEHHQRGRRRSAAPNAKGAAIGGGGSASGLGLSPGGGFAGGGSGDVGAAAAAVARDQLAAAQAGMGGVPGWGGAHLGEAPVCSRADAAEGQGSISNKMGTPPGALRSGSKGSMSDWLLLQQQLGGGGEDVGVSTALRGGGSSSSSMLQHRRSGSSGRMALKQQQMEGGSP